MLVPVQCCLFFWYQLEVLLQDSASAADETKRNGQHPGTVSCSKASGDECSGNSLYVVEREDGCNVP